MSIGRENKLSLWFVSLFETVYILTRAESQLLYTMGHMQKGIGRTVYDNKNYNNLGSVMRRADKKKRQIEMDIHHRELDALDNYIIAEDPFRGPGKTVRMVLFREIRTIQPDRMKLIVNWSGKEFVRESWTRFVEDSFPIVNEQEIMDLFLVVNMRSVKPNRCFNYTAQHALRTSDDYIPIDTIKPIEPVYLCENKEYRISLAKRSGGCPLMNLHREFTNNFEEFYDRAIWSHFYRPLVYIGTDSGEDEEVLCDVSLVFKIKEFAPDAPLFNGPGY